MDGLAQAGARQRLRDERQGRAPERMGERHGEAPDRRAERHVGEHEHPREGVPVLELADEHLQHEHRKQRRGKPQDAGGLAPDPDQLPADEQEADPVDRRRADVDVDGVADLDPEAVDRVVRARVRPGRRGDGAGDDHHRAPDDADERHQPEPARRNGRATTARVPPRLPRDHHGERDDDEREQEVGHHRERVQVEDHGEAAERDLGDRAEEGGERRPPHPPRQPVDPAGGEPRDERGEDPHDRDDAVPELDHGVEVLRGERGVPAPRPVVAAEARSGQSHERARRDDEPEYGDRAESDPDEPCG